MVLRELDRYMQKKNFFKWDHQLTPYTRISSKWIKDLNISCDTIEILEKKRGSKISHILRSNIFADISPRAKEMKEEQTNGTTKIKKCLQS